jgi:hypothetical protein
MFATEPGLVGNPAIQLRGFTNDTTPKVAQGQIIAAASPYWGGGEFIYARANGSIRGFGLCVLTPVYVSGIAGYRYEATEVPNTANLGRSLCVSQNAMSSGDYGWFMISGVTPVNCQAAVSADTTFGIAAAGQGGANGAGKQVLNARVTAASTTTVAIANCSAQSGSTTLNVPSCDGWFVGVYLSGTGVASGATVVSIDAPSRTVVMSAVSTAAINGTVTATYNNSTVYYNVAHINRPFAQGAVS